MISHFCILKRSFVLGRFVLLKRIDFPPPIWNLAIPCVMELLVDCKPTFKVHTVAYCIRMWRPADSFCNGFIWLGKLWRMVTWKKSFRSHYPLKRHYLITSEVFVRVLNIHFHVIWVRFSAITLPVPPHAALVKSVKATWLLFIS